MPDMPATLPAPAAPDKPERLERIPPRDSLAPLFAALPGSPIPATTALLIFGNPDHAAGDARSRVACRLRFQIVRFRMN